MAMRLVERIRFLFRIFLLFTFLAAVATISAITTIKLTIQGNQETLPDWVGVNLEIARGEAADMGLEMKVEDKLFSDKYAADKIISQEPQPGTKVKVGQHVHVLVSLGPPRIVVPDLLGSSARVAQILAVQKGLAVGDIAEVHWPGLETDEVVAQDPPPSTTEIRSPAINFLVSIGENTQAYVCPDFLGKRLDTVLPLVQRAGFSVSKVTPITGTAAPPGTILGQTPVPGSKISAGDSFTFQVAQGNNAAAPPASAPMVSH
jgi:serine/threonine-protein kinase